MKGDVRFVFESITGMQELWEGEEKISRFYSHTCPRLYELNTIGYWIMEKEAHSKRLKAAINQIAQVAIELFLKRGKTSLSILKAENRELEDANTPHPYAVKGFNITFDTKKHITSQIDLGKRVRDLRTKKGFSQTEIAKLVGVTPSNISQIESNQIYPSLTALYKIAETLGVDMSSLFQELRDTRKEIVFSEADAVDIQIPDMPKGSVSARLLAPVDSETKVEPYLIEIPPGKSLSSHFFVHKGEEVGYMLSGKLQLKLGNSTYTLRSGDVVHLITEMPSHWKNPGPGTVRMFWLKIK
jgi:transcriptional regulator with XRE-family HTH domain